MLVVMNIFQAIGFFGFGNWLPALLSGNGTSVTHSLLYAFFITLAYPLGALICSRYADRMENKWQIVLSCLTTVIFGSLFALQSNPLLLIACGFFITWSNAWLTYSYHPISLRFSPPVFGRAVGFCYSFSRLSTVFSSIIIGLILQYSGSRQSLPSLNKYADCDADHWYFWPQHARYRPGKYLITVTNKMPSHAG
jgi:putative MFS transporter